MCIRDSYGGENERRVNAGGTKAMSASRTPVGNTNMRENVGYNQGNVRENMNRTWNRENAGGMDVKCFRCGKMGHLISECRWANGSCFSCGQAVSYTHLRAHETPEHLVCR